MLSEYLDAAMKIACYEVMEDGQYWGEVPTMPGVWAAAESAEACQRELREVAEEWTLMAYWLHHTLPIIGGIDPNLNMQIEPRRGETAGTGSQADVLSLPEPA